MSMSSGKRWETLTSTRARTADVLSPATLITDGYGDAKVGGAALSLIVIPPDEQNWTHWSSCAQPPPSEHVSTVQVTPSSHGFGGCVQAPVAGVQTSVVQTRPSSQLIGVPFWHTLETHVSTPLQRSPSEQSAATLQLVTFPSRRNTMSVSVSLRQVASVPQVVHPMWRPFKGFCHLAAFPVRGARESQYHWPPAPLARFRFATTETHFVPGVSTQPGIVIVNVPTGDSTKVAVGKSQITAPGTPLELA